MSGALEQLARELAREASDKELRLRHESLEAELAAHVATASRPRRRRVATIAGALWRGAWRR
jgi:hypothetical protein